METIKLAPELQVEYGRILAGGVKGLFTLLHHEGPILEASENVKKRLDYIVTRKPQSEQLLRLRNIAILTPEVEQEYLAIEKPAMEAYEAVQKPAWEAYWAVIVKPTSEKPTREAYEAIEKPAREAYDAVEKPAALKALKAVRPDNTWNGTNIFTQEKHD